MAVLPRYDLPNAAPEPLRLVQRLVNSRDQEHGREWIGTPEELGAWLGAREKVDDVARAHLLRNVLLALLRANNGEPLDHEAVAVLNRESRRLAFELGDDGSVRIVGEDALDD